MKTISDFMKKEHDKLDVLWEIFFQEKNFKQTLPLLNKFKQHLSAHMKLEEEFLFPYVSQLIGFPSESNLTKLVKKDHKAILKLLEFVDHACRGEDQTLLCLHRQNLHRALREHRKREEKIHYPVSDFFVKEKEWKNMLQQTITRKALQDKQPQAKESPKKEPKT